MMNPDERAADYRSSLRFFKLVFLTGLLLPAVLGIVIRTIIAAKGVPVATWTEGVAWVLPLTLFILIPYALLAFYSRHVLLKVRDKPAARFQMWLYIFIGAYAGMTSSLSFLLVQVLQSIRDIAHVVAFWPFTIVGVLLWAMGGAFIAGLVGWIVWAIQYRLIQRQDGSPSQ